MTIIKATIYAARVGEAAGDKFVGSDGRVYDGVGKAFSNLPESSLASVVGRVSKVP